MSSAEIASIEAKLAALLAKNNALEARVAFLESQVGSSAPVQASGATLSAESDSAHAAIVRQFSLSAICTHVGLMNQFSSHFAHLSLCAATWTLRPWQACGMRPPPLPPRPPLDFIVKGPSILKSPLSAQNVFLHCPTLYEHVIHVPTSPPPAVL